MEASKGWLAPDGNRSCRVNPKASLTARRIFRAVAKAEVSEPMVIFRIARDHQPKATPGITG